MICKVKTKKKYPFKRMSLGETFKLNDLDVRDAQTITAASVSARLRFSSLKRMTAIIAAALLK